MWSWNSSFPSSPQTCGAPRVGARKPWTGLSVWRLPGPRCWPEALCGVLFNPHCPSTLHWHNHWEVARLQPHAGVELGSLGDGTERLGSGSPRGSLQRALCLSLTSFETALVTVARCLFLALRTFMSWSQRSSRIRRMASRPDGGCFCVTRGWRTSSWR